ncbi:MAG: WYL domain-containing protein [Methylocystaceae bacterium]|jgi:predicted DNA-binding transcriptional regulator YafY|nr:WYL domain-containing protein [Methylocystaceae bacterium]
MRLEKATAILNLARQLASSAEGLTLDEIADTAEVGRRTAERMRDAVDSVFGPLDHIDDGRKKRFRIVARGLGSFATAPTSEELLELENAARKYEKSKDPLRASILRSLATKIQSSLRDGDRRRLSTDVDALVRAESFARQVGPRPYADPQILSLIRQALLCQRFISFTYASNESTRKQHQVIPYGLIFSARYYLVACKKDREEPALYRLDRIKTIKVMEEFGAPPETFNLEEYANRSFAVFQETPEDIVLRFKPEVATDAQAYLFHPTQSSKIEKDGALTVAFRAGGLMQIAHHLLTWGDAVTIIDPPRLKEIIRAEVKSLYAHYNQKK